MALLPATIPSGHTTVAVNDYTGSPNSLAFGALLAEAQRPPIGRKYAKAEVMTNSSTGIAQYATPHLGLQPGHTFTLSHRLLDVKNDTDATTPVSFFRAMFRNSASGTGYSAWTFTNPLTGGGALAFKLLYTQRGTDGTTHVTTIPVICEGFEESSSDNVEDFTVTLKVIGTPTTA